MKRLRIDRDNPFTSCWKLDVDYGGLGRGIGKFNNWAAGEGYLIRHLCSDKKCINPLHLVKGTHAENMEDETIKRNILKNEVHRAGLHNAGYRDFAFKMEQTLRGVCLCDISTVAYCCSVNTQELIDRANDNYGIHISRVIKKEFDKYPWTEIFDRQVKKALQLWEIVHNSRRVHIIEEINTINWMIGGLPL